MSEINQLQNITDFLNNEYKSYARYVVLERAVPHFADGMKVSQRKALATAIKYAKDRPVKVSALGGYCMATMGYHHGDTSIQGAITVMAQEFMQGMPMLDRKSQMGTLHDSIAGAPGYTSVKLSGWAQLLLRDEKELKYLVDEDTGCQIEPKYYLPLLPMLLINGTNGIAVGYSSSFANYNPLEVALAVREYLVYNKLNDYKLTPYINGHTALWSYWNGAFESCAPWHRKNTTVLAIDGLPLNMQLVKYRGYLSMLQEQGQIKRFVDLSCNGKASFEIHMSQQALDDLIASNGVAGMFKLIERLPADNMTCIMPDNSIRRYQSPLEVVKDFVDFRLKFYVKRKKRLINELKDSIVYFESLVKFIELVNAGEITFKGVTKKALEEICDKHCIVRQVLQVPVYNLTEDHKQKHLHEIARLNKELTNVINTTERDMYLQEIDELLTHIRKFYHIENVLNIKDEYLPRIHDIV